jgi:hypothetical protein
VTRCVAAARACDARPAPPPGFRVTLVAAEMTAAVEQVIDPLVAGPPLRPVFVVPGTTQPGAMLEVARAVVRRAGQRVGILGAHSAHARQLGQPGRQVVYRAVPCVCSTITTMRWPSAAPGSCPPSAPLLPVASSSTTKPHPAVTWSTRRRVPCPSR